MRRPRASHTGPRSLALGDQRQDRLRRRYDQLTQGVNVDNTYSCDVWKHATCQGSTQWLGPWVPCPKHHVKTGPTPWLHSPCNRGAGPAAASWDRAPPTTVHWALHSLVPEHGGEGNVRPGDYAPGRFKTVGSTLRRTNLPLFWPVRSRPSSTATIPRSMVITGQPAASNPSQML